MVLLLSSRAADTDHYHKIQFESQGDKGANSLTANPGKINTMPPDDTAE